VPAGSVSVRVVRGAITADKNVIGHPVEFDVNGAKRTINTDASGRAVISGLASGTRLQASTVVDGQRITSQAVTLGSSGLRFVLVGPSAEVEAREAENAALAAGPATSGLVVFGPETRVVAQLHDDRLTIFYVIEIVNTARTPVDTGGPVLVDLPTGARGGATLEGSAGQATVNGPRLTVTGPFPPGSTTVRMAYELPYSGGTARFAQRWPVAMQQVNVLVVQSGGLDLRSPQIERKRQVNDRGQELIAGNGPGLPAGGLLELEISGLPHYARWPRHLALSLAGIVMTLGIWGAVYNKPRRRHA
jgi:hypothetical protein